MRWRWNSTLLRPQWHNSILICLNPCSSWPPSPLALEHPRKELQKGQQPWTDEEDNILKENHARLSDDRFGRLLRMLADLFLLGIPHIKMMHHMYLCMNNGTGLDVVGVMVISHVDTSWYLWSYLALGAFCEESAINSRHLIPYSSGFLSFDSTAKSASKFHRICAITPSVKRARAPSAHAFCVKYFHSLGGEIYRSQRERFWHSPFSCCFWAKSHWLTTGDD